MRLPEIHNRREIPKKSTGGITCYSSESRKRRGTVTISESDHLAELSKAGICPNCGKPIAKGKSVVRGAGAFCSLDCVASYYQAEFSERARRLAAAARH